MSLSRRRIRFTLIELMVVIAIVVVLAAVGAPAVMTALRRAQVSACLQNVRGIIPAMVAVIANDRNELPLFYAPNNPGSLAPEANTSWDFRLNNSGFNHAQFKCPNAPAYVVPGTGVENILAFSSKFCYQNDYQVTSVNYDEDANNIDETRGVFFVNGQLKLRDVSPNTAMLSDYIRFANVPNLQNSNSAVVMPQSGSNDDPLVGDYSQTNGAVVPNDDGGDVSLTFGNHSNESMIIGNFDGSGIALNLTRSFSNNATTALYGYVTVDGDGKNTQVENGLGLGRAVYANVGIDTASAFTAAADTKEAD